jgi:hypothetical protein
MFTSLGQIVTTQNIHISSEILEWSQERPGWQRDALRRLFVNGKVKPDEIGDLVDLCKAAKGLSAPRAPEVLSNEHLAIKDGISEAVSLVSLIHHHGANALAPEQTVSFCPNLTIVYGANAAGKSGYARILKRACRSRSTEEILGNVLSGETPTKMQATIKFRQGPETTPVAEWKVELPPSAALAAVSVFDAGSAPVYLRDKTDVAFRPFGLDIFDQLSTICGEVRSRLEAEKEKLSTVTPGLPLCAEGTRPRALIDNLTSLTNPDDVRALGGLSADDEARLNGLRTKQRDLQAKDPKQRARELKLKADRHNLAARHINGLSRVLGSDGLARLRSSTDSLRAAREALTVVRESALTPDLLPGTGEVAWQKMWDAGSAFSAVAYPGSAFPVVTERARCPFCQQEIGEGAGERLRHFAEFVSSNAQARVREEEKVQADLLLEVTQLTVARPEVDLALTELAEDNAVLAQVVRDFLQEAERIQKEVQKTTKRGALPATDVGRSPEVDLKAAATSLQNRARQLEGESPTLTAEEITELRELEARVTLGAHVNGVCTEIERKKRIAAYDQCLTDTSTQAITRKSTDLTTRLVTDHLRTIFQDELSKLDFRHLAVEMQSAGGARGALYHRLVFTNAPGIPVIRVLSEGESRTLSLAAFLTELSTASSRSAIIFDDPVSSLDHEWRERIAKRLVSEAKVRQVIVFTHDILFLRFLLDEAKRQNVECQNQYVRRDDQAGLCSSDLPWIAMPISDRIGKLRNLWQAAEKQFRTSPEAYEPEARHIYGLLREAWEQAIAEVLLNDVVERYRHSIESQKVRHLHDITPEDCKVVEDAMTECSRWIRGHDQPAADATPLPKPPAIKKLIDDLEAWVKGIRKRRQK